MRKRSKRYQEAAKLVEEQKLYDVQEAFDVLTQIASNDKCKTKFTEAVEISLNLNLKARHTIRDTMTFPNAVSTDEKKILVFAKGDFAQEAKDAGADFVGDVDLVEKIKGGWFDFDIAIAEKSMMRDVGKLGKILGPKGLMPNPKTGTVTTAVGQAVKEFKKGKVEFRADKTGIIHMKIGNVGMGKDQLLENLKALYSEVLRRKPTDLKGDYVKSVAISTAMGPGIRILNQSLN